MALIAKAHAYSVARISLSWLLAKPVVTSVIIGAKRLDQSEENLAAVEVKLTEDELKLLDQVTALRPNIPVGCSPLTAPAVWESLTVLFGTICVSLRARHSDYAERLVLITLVLIDAAKIRASEVRKQKTDERDARLILDLMLAKRFPKIWVPTPGERDFRQLLWHRHKLVCLRTTLGNQLHALAMSQGLCRKKKLFTKKGRGELTSLTLGFWASRRRAELLKLLDQVEAPVGELDRAVLDEAQRREEAVRLMSHPGVGPITALAFVLTIGPITRFPRSRKLVSYLGLSPSEESSGERRRTGAISKQGNTMLRWLLVEAGQKAARSDPALRQDYQRLKFRRGHAVAKVAIARKLAVRMYWMLRSGADYARLVRRSEERIMVGKTVTE